MMGLCACKRGFFALRDCKELANKDCEECRRPVCTHHLSAQSGFSVCVECAARQRESTDRTQDPDLDETYDNDWSYSYRHDYYSHDNYHPIYWGSSHDPYYDSYDMRSFDSPLVESDPGGEDGRSDFGDS